MLTAQTDTRQRNLRNASASVLGITLENRIFFPQVQQEVFSLPRGTN